MKGKILLIKRCIVCDGNVYITNRMSQEVRESRKLCSERCSKAYEFQKFINVVIPKKK